MKPLAAGGTHQTSNLQPLCHRCHSEKTAREDGGFGFKSISNNGKRV
ncbi:HNH endonuclease [Scandinavium sp.]